MTHTHDKGSYPERIWLARVSGKDGRARSVLEGGTGDLDTNRLSQERVMTIHEYLAHKLATHDRELTDERAKLEEVLRRYNERFPEKAEGTP